MDSRLRRLYVAANAGDIDSLKMLLEEDELLNGQGLSPLHLAAVHGHYEVAKELLQVDSGLCYVRENKNGYLPVHTAVIKGRHDIVTLLLEKCKDSVSELTDTSETLIHLAIKTKRSETVEFFTKRGDMQLLLNAKDVNGNTSLHIAIAGRQQKVVKHLLSQTSIEVNSINSAGLTPLDVLLVTNHEIGDLHLGEMLRAAGGKMAKELGPSNTNLLFNSSSSDGQQASEVNADTSTPSNQKKSRSKIEQDKYNNLIVVATLVATVTFAAALNPPGGAIQMPFAETDRDDGTWLSNWRNMTNVYPAGSPVYMWQLRKFFMYDYFALFASVSVILLCLAIPGIMQRNQMLHKLLLLVLWSAMLSMVLAFTSALSVLLYRDKYLGPYHWFSKLFNIWLCFFVLASAPLFFGFIFSLVKAVARKACPKWIVKHRKDKRWRKFEKILSIASIIAIGSFVVFGLCLTIYILMDKNRD